MSGNIVSFGMINGKVSSVFLTLLFFLTISSVFVKPVCSSSFWMENGSYAEYTFPMSHIIFVNGTLRNFGFDILTTWRWECVMLVGEMATLRTSLNVVGKNVSLLFEKDVEINVATRDVFFLNGTAMGATFLWAPTNVESGKQLMLWKTSTESFTPTVQSIVTSITPQGSQKVFIAQGNGTILEREVFLVGFYDFDTGVLIDGRIDSEVTLFMLGIKDLGITGRIYFVDTNINLGPPETKPDSGQSIALLFVVIIILLIFAVISLIFYRVRRIDHKNKNQRKKRKKTFIHFINQMRFMSVVAVSLNIYYKIL